MVKQIVLEKGWVTGGCGVLTATKLKDLLFLLRVNQPGKASEKVADLMKRAKALMGWVEGAWFPGNVVVPPPPLK